MSITLEIVKREMKLSSSETHFEKWPLVVIIEGLLGLSAFIVSYKLFNLNVGQLILLLASFSLLALFIMRIAVYSFKKEYLLRLEQKKKTERINEKKRVEIFLKAGCLCSWQFSINARILKFDENSFRMLGTRKIYYTFEELLFNKDIQRILADLENENIRYIDDEVYFPEMNKWFIVRGRCIDSEIKLKPNQFIGIIFDNTERKNHLKQMETLSITDELTGLKNRRFFFESFQKELNHYARLKKVFTVAIFDLDYFKKINDTWGHLAGDYVLKSFSDLIKNEVRPYDLVARFGGEEFVVLFPDITKESACQIVNRIKDKLSREVFLFEGQHINYTFSCGIGDASELGLYTEKEFITIIDTRLYEAKHSGRNLIISGG